MSNGDTADWFEVTNYGDTAADITGYQVDDSSFLVASSLPLNGITSIAPGESVVFLEGNATTVTTFKTNWSLDGLKQVGYYSGSGIGLSSAGDGVTLFNNSAANSGTELAGPFSGLIRLSFPAATTGTSFNWSYDVSGNSTSPAAGQLTATTSTWSNASIPMIGTPGVPTPNAPASPVSIAAASINEGNSGTVVLNLPVSRTDSFNAFTVDYAVTGGTATSGTDYVALSAGTLTFTSGGANSQNIAITINGDTVIESSETITVTLSNLNVTVGQATLATASASGTITNDDAVPLAFPPTNAFTSTVKGFVTLDGAEIPAFDPVSKRAFASSNVGIQVVDLTNPAVPVKLTTITPASLGVSGLTSNDVSSIAVRKGTGGNPSVLAAAMISSPKTSVGYVIFLNAADSSLLGSIAVGANPDHINFTPDGTKLLVANEGELDGTAADVAVDATLGTVSIINLAAGFSSLSATTADFTAFDSQVAALRTAGVRIFKNAGGTDAVPSRDFEPEYFAISADSTKAMVTLQEANAVAVLDIATSTFTSVKALGKKDFSTLRADFSDRDGAGASALVNPTTGSPVFGLYMPDAIASYSSGGQTYFVTANEGDDRNDFLTPDETTTVSNAGYDLDDTIFPNEATLKTNAVLGRLSVVNTLGNRGDTDGDGDIDEIQMLGARSFSILDAAGNRVFDSGDMIEMIVASQHLANFDDGRSDNKGPEPEGVTVASFGGRSYAFVGLERSGMVLAFDVTNPAAVTYTTSFKRSGDQNPEGLVVVSAADSPSGKPLLLTANEVSNTLSIFEIDGAPAADYTLQILHYYGESGLLGIQTAPIMGAMIDKFDNDYANTIVVGEGDSFIPGPWLVAGADPTFNRLLHTGTFTSAADTTATPFAQADVAIMNLFGTSVSALGNHEFDLGSPVLSGAMFPATSSTLGNWAGAQFPLITANLDFAGDSSLKSRVDTTLGGTGGAIAGSEVTALKAKIAPYAIKTINGQKIGFIGATTWELLSKSSPNGTVPKDDANASTSDLQEVAAYLQSAINSLQALGVNKIVMVDQLDTLQRNKDLAGLVTGIDVMVAGGGHERMGDATDTAVPFNGHDADFISDAYPILTVGADSKPVLIVTSDTEYSYLGRLVVDFDANGELITSNLSTAINGAYAASEATLQAVYNTSDSASTIIAASTIGSGVKTITDQISTIVTAKDSNVFGYTNVYLEGDRVFGRTQEVNLGNITADANALKARTALSLPETAAVFSLKNGGGLRASLGSVLPDGTKVGPVANPITSKPANAISQLDIENALRFDNKLMVFDTTPTGLLAILNFASGLSSGPTVQSGGYPQVGNIRFSYDSTQLSGAKVRSVSLVNEAGDIVARIVENGVVLPDAPATISCVSLSFTANGGDSYPIKANADNFRYVLTNGTLSAAVSEALDFTSTGIASVGLTATDIMGEQKAFQDFLAARHATAGAAYTTADTPVAQDRRIQQLAQNGSSDTVNTGAVFMPTFAFSAATSNVSEAAGSVVLTINRTGITDTATTITLNTANGTAVAGTDYVAQSSVSVAFASNETSKTVSVPVINRAGFRASRTFTVSLTPGSITAVTTPSTATVTITEGDTFGALTGPTSSATPYLVPAAPGWQTTSLLTVGDSVGGYAMVGIPDGLGAYDNNNGTITLLMNHELGNAVGGTRAHGAVGSFVSEWIINKSTLAVTSGADLIQTVYGWDSANQVTGAALSNVAITRLCSADLPPVSAFYNAATGKGTQERLFMSGEEGGSFGWAFAHVATGADKGKSYILGKFNLATNGSGGTAVGGWENVVANPYAQDKTVVVGLNDGGTTVMNNRVNVYVGNKQTTGNEADKAGLNNGALYFINVTGNAAEITNSSTRATGITSGTRFTMDTAGGTQFSRPEDGAWDPVNPNRFYFVTTDQRDQVADGIGTGVGRTRLWSLVFDSITNPEAGGVINLLATGCDGTNDANMWDNMGITEDGSQLLLQEDVGGAPHNGKVWSYNTATGVLTKVLKHDPARFGDIVSGSAVAAVAPFNNDEESSGMIDVTKLLGGNGRLGDRYYLAVVQAHYSLSSPLVEGGQLVLVRESATRTGPSSSASPYLIPMTSNWQTTSVLSVGDTVGGYSMVGIPDGLGAYDNGNGTVTLLMNHELGNTVGGTRAHGAVGSFVSEWVINKSTLAVTSGADLIQSIYGWDNTAQASNATTSVVALNRLCSADLPAVSAFYNAATGLGTQTRIFMNGEEGGSNGYALANVATGADKGKSYILGKFNPKTNGTVSGVDVGGWENVLASPYAQDKTVVVGLNDGGTGIMNNRINVYVGTKTNSGSEADKAGLTNGSLYFINVTGNAAEIVNSTTRATNITSGTRFTMNTAGGTQFSRPEDGAWDPVNRNRFYFVTTDQRDQVADGIGTGVGRTRLWSLVFDDVTNPTVGGVINLLATGADGSNDANMWDNMGITRNGKLLLQEDVGGAPHNGKVWSYDPVTGALTKVLKHDPARFGDIVDGFAVAATSPFSNDEESSGMIDVSEFFGVDAAAGERAYFAVVQAHYSLSSPLVEGGQLVFARELPTLSEALATPTDLALSSTEILDGSPANTTVGTLSATDANAGDTHTFSLVSGTGDADNASFAIVGNALRVTSAVNFVSKDSYSVRIRATDSSPSVLSYEESFTISVDASDGSVSFSVADVGVNQGSTSVTLNILRTGGANATSVLLSTTDGTATAGVDYTALTNQVVSFPASTNTATVTITLSGAPLTVARKFTATISPVPSAATIGAVSTATIRIQTTDVVKPVVTIGASTPLASVPENGTDAVAIAGTVKDNSVSIDRVEVSLNGGAPVNATLTPTTTGANYTVNVTAVGGSNTVRVQAFDANNNASLLVAKTFTYVVNRVVSVVVNPGSTAGSVTGLKPSYQVGNLLTLTAVAKTGFIFDHWSGAGLAGVATEVPVLNVVFTDALAAAPTITAHFIDLPFDDAVIGEFNGLVIADGSSTPSNATNGMISTLKVSKTGTFTGTLKIDGLSLSLIGLFDNLGVAKFGPARTPTLIVTRPGKPGYELALNLDVATSGNTNQITGTLKQRSRSTVVSNSIVTLDRAFYSATNPVPANYLANKGFYTVALPARATQTGLVAADYPQGDGVGSITVTNLGKATLTATLADGTIVTAFAPLSKNRSVPLYAQLYLSKGGSIGGLATLNDALADSDVAGTDLFWFRPYQKVHHYPWGWPEGIEVDLVGAKYAVPVGASVLPLLTGGSPNATLTFSDGLLTTSINKNVTISTLNKVTNSPVTDKSFTLAITAASGAISGSFTHSNGTQPKFSGVILQKGANRAAFGYFLTVQPKVITGLGESGAVSLIHNP